MSGKRHNSFLLSEFLIIGPAPVATFGWGSRLAALADFLIFEFSYFRECTCLHSNALTNVSGQKTKAY